MPTPSIIAHRGASGKEYENSRAAFQRAVELGADGVELDVHSTADGIILVHHDPELDGVGPIGHLQFPELRDYHLPNGETVPTLPEALDILALIRVYVEVKTLTPEFDAALFSVLDQGPAPDHYAVHGFDHRIIARLGKRRPGLERGILLASYPLDVLGMMQAAGARTLWQDQRLIDQDLVTLLHGAGHRLIAWTVNNDSDARRLANLGVDGLCTNYPDRVRRAAEDTAA